MDYSKFLVLYSGGVDSTYFVESEATAKYLIHYESPNPQQTRVAAANATGLGRFLTIVPLLAGPQMPGRDGEINEIHALYDTSMVLDAGIKALSFGMKGIVACFNADDIGVEFKALETIFRRVDPGFSIALPLRKMPAAKVRAKNKASKLVTVSCMVSDKCGHCAKCRRGY
jgi:7-cyano-7-deazaguanine synthase in queuosine biosynthesis